MAVAEAGYSGNLSGIDQVVTLGAQNTTAPASVTGISRAACAGGIFGAPVAVSPGGWPVAAGGGFNGADAIEGFVPLAGLGAGSTVRLYVGANPAGQGVADVILSQDGSSGGSAILAAFAGGSPASIPTLHPGALALLALAIAAMTHRRLRRHLPPLAAVTLAVTLGLAGGKSAEAVLVTITPDGNIADWSGIAPAAQDALGDTANGNPANDLAALLLAADGANLYYRVDVAGLAPVDHAPVVNAPTGTATDTTVTETNHITDTDGLRNVTYYLYQNDGSTLVSSNATGAFTGLTGGTTYKMKATAETYNPVTATWTLQTSPLAAITTAVTVVDHAPVVAAPTGTATDTTITETNQISDADGLRNVTYYLYQNDGSTLVSSNATGAFTGLTGGTTYKMKTTAETYNPVTATWTLQTSPLAAITTAVTVVDHAPVVAAPTGTATDTTVTETNTIADADGLRNVTYYLYQNDGTTLVGSNTTGSFSGLTGSTPYKMKTTAETYNPVTATWTLQTSPLAAITTAVTVVDHAPVVAAPTGTATDTTITETNQISDADGLRNVTYYLYQNDGATLVSSNATGAFSGLAGGTPYKMKTTAETYNPATATWTLQTSPLAAITTAVTVVDHAPVVAAPTGTATDTTVTETNHITDADGLRNVTYYLSQNDGTTLVSSNATGAFTGLAASTPYKMKTSAETYNPATGAWTLQTSPLAAIATAAAEVPPVMGDVPDQSTPLDVPITNINLASYVTLTNGDPILSYAIASGSLPPGLVLDTASGVISGTPTATGSYTVTVRATDNDGPGNADSITFTVNVVAPGAAPSNFILTNDSGSSPSDGITMNQPAASWMTVAGASSYEVSTNGTTWTDVGNVTGYAFGGLADGGYTLQVRAKNGAGTGPAASKAVTLDTTPPTAPAGNEAMTPDETRSISVTFNEAIQSTAAITVNSGTLNSYAVAGNVLTINYTASATGGTYNNALSVVATNLAGVASAAVGVNVVVNSAPTATNATAATLDGGTTFTYDLAANIADAQDPTASLIVIVVTPPAHGSLAWNTNSSFTFTTALGYAGNDSFTYKVRDTGGLESTVQTVTLPGLAN